MWHSRIYAVVSLVKYVITKENAWQWLFFKCIPSIIRKTHEASMANSMHKTILYKRWILHGFLYIFENRYSMSIKVDGRQFIKDVPLATKSFKPTSFRYSCMEHHGETYSVRFLCSFSSSTFCSWCSMACKVTWTFSLKNSWHPSDWKFLSLI